MRRAALAMAMVWAAGLAWGGEVGTRFEVGDRASAIGWIQFAVEPAMVRLTGRIEGDLLCGCLRRAQLGVSTTWGGLSPGVEAVVLGTGRVDASVTGSWRTLARTGLGVFSAQVGGRTTAMDLLGSRTLTGAGWAFGRLDVDPWWIEVSGNVALPGGRPQAELRLGFAGPMWATLSVSGSGIGVELGAGPRELFAQTYISLRPAFQTITVGLGGEDVRAQIRLTVRAQGSPSGSFTLNTSHAPWRGSVGVSFSGLALDKVTAEVRYAFQVEP